MFKQESDRAKIFYQWTGLGLMVVLLILIGVSIHKHRQGRLRFNGEIDKGIQWVWRGLDGNCSAFDGAKEIFLKAARSRIWLNREIAWIGFCEDLQEFCGQNPDQLEERLKKIIELGQDKLAHEAKFQLAMLKIRDKDFSASERLLKELTHGKDAHPKAERSLLFLKRLKASWDR